MSKLKVQSKFMKKNKISTVTPYSSRKFTFADLPFIPASLRPPDALAQIPDLTQVVYCSYDWISIKASKVNLKKCKVIENRKLDYVTRGKVKQYELDGQKFKVVLIKNNEKISYKIELNPRAFKTYSELIKFLQKIIKSPEEAKLLRLDICIFLKADLFRVEWLRGCIGYEGRWYTEEYPCVKPQVIKHGGGYMESLVYGNGQTRLSVYSKRTKSLYDIKDVNPIPNTVAIELELKSSWLKENDILTICHLKDLNYKKLLSEISFNDVWVLPDKIQAKDTYLFYTFFLNCMAYGYQQARQNFYAWNNNRYDRLNEALMPLRVGKQKSSLSDVICSTASMDLKSWLKDNPRPIPLGFKSAPLGLMMRLF